MIFSRIGIVLALSLLLGIPLRLRAAGGDVSLSPLFHEVSFSETDTDSRAIITISNATDSDARFTLSAVDFGTLDESGGVAFLGGNGDFERRYGLASWIRLPADRIIIPSGETEKVPILIENRDSLSPGGHYGAVIFYLAHDDASPSASDSVAVRSSFASLFFVKKSGGVVTELEYGDTNLADRDLFGIPHKLRIRFRNAGNVHMVPRGTVRVLDSRGRTVRTGVLNEDSGRMLPESYRSFSVPLRKIAPVFVPGTYRISIDYRFDGSDEFVTAPPVSFVPIPMLLFWGGALAFLFGCCVFAVKRWKRS